MKIILSRKGFDSANGGCASPVFPDGTMLSMPIPSEEGAISFNDVYYNGMSYADLLKQINPKCEYNICHLDPDINPNTRKETILNWIPAFGQKSSSSSYLHNANVEVGDIFLFFGWYHKVVQENGKYRYTTKNDKYYVNNFFDYSDFHAIWGYLQIGEIITDKEKIKKFYWHPHSQENFLSDNTNTLFIPSKSLSFNPDLPGYGTLKCCKDRILTMEGKTKGNWKREEAFAPENVYGNRKNSSKYPDCIYYKGIWQELVLKETASAYNWAKTIIE